MIPNIVKGPFISGALAFVMGEGRDEATGEALPSKPFGAGRARLLGGQNFGFEIDNPERLDLASRFMEWQVANALSRTRRIEKPCLHASLSWQSGLVPSADEMVEAGTEFLRAIGLDRALAVFVAHDDQPHAHLHIVACRIDPETGLTLAVPYDYVVAQRWAREWERAHGQQRGRAITDAEHDALCAADPAGAQP